MIKLLDIQPEELQPDIEIGWISGPILLGIRIQNSHFMWKIGNIVIENIWSKWNFLYQPHPRVSSCLTSAGGPNHAGHIPDVSWCYFVPNLTKNSERITLKKCQNIKTMFRICTSFFPSKSHKFKKNLLLSNSWIK